MVDTVVLEAIAARRESSSLSLSTKRSTRHCIQSVGVSKYSERRLNPESNCWFYLPRWRNGSVFLLHGNGSSSILLRGTKFWVANKIPASIFKSIWSLL